MWRVLRFNHTAAILTLRRVFSGLFMVCKMAKRCGKQELYINWQQIIWRRAVDSTRGASLFWWCDLRAWWWSVEPVFNTVLFITKVMLLGDSGVGKTCLLVRFKDGAFLSGSFISTVGIDFKVNILYKIVWVHLCIGSVFTFTNLLNSRVCISRCFALFFTAE